MKALFTEVDVKGRRVVVREDFNVPLRDGHVGDDTRIRAALPTLRGLARRGARVVALSHLGRPKGRVISELSLRPVAERLRQLLGGQVSFADDCVGPVAHAAAAALKDGDVLLLENVRFHPGDESNDPDFATQLSALGELYVNDAFACAHRAHASVVGIADRLPAYAGYLMVDELAALHRALDAPARPLVAIVGGVKVSTKAGLLRHLLGRVDCLLVGGAMANTFWKALGREVGASVVEEDALDEARRVWDLAAGKLVLPVDAVCARAPEAGQEMRICKVDAIPPGWMVLDTGPGTRKLFAERVDHAGTIVWNGPVGVSEVPEFSEGTRALGLAVAASGAFSLVGGGDTAAAVHVLGLEGRYSHVSTGGGATLEYLEGRKLPGVAVLREAVNA